MLFRSILRTSPSRASRTSRKSPDFREARITLANLLDDEGAPAEAVRILSSMLDGDDVPVMVYEILGRALTRMGQSEAAMDALTIAAARKAEAMPTVG